MIYEYALDPKIVATWGDPKNYRFYSGMFGLGTGRCCSRYPKNWTKKVWEAFKKKGQNMDHFRLEQLLLDLRLNRVKRKDCEWNKDQKSWINNALEEHKRYPFHAIIVSKNLQTKPYIIVEDEIGLKKIPKWSIPHSRPVQRQVNEMTSAIKEMLNLCNWIRFIDPNISPGKERYKQSLRSFLKVLSQERPVGHIQSIEVHTKKHKGTIDFLKESYSTIIPEGIQITLYQWKQKKFTSQKLHNRHILTDLGGVTFNHGLDIGNPGEMDSLGRLDRDDYLFWCDQYNPDTKAFSLAEQPLTING